MSSKRVKSLERLDRFKERELLELQGEKARLESEREGLVELLKAERSRFLAYRQERDAQLATGDLIGTQVTDQGLERLKESLRQLYESILELDQQIQNIQHHLQLKRQERRQVERLVQRMKRRQNSRLEARENQLIESFLISRGKKNEL